ncbi:MAG TPA: hypothetical protein PKH79_10225 [Prolixibacteraceae bacterium]|nr:hypothetical protein [Prolixibacteraceae bacterium]
MKTMILAIFLCMSGVSHAKLPVEIRVEKQSMSTPMSLLDDVFFSNYYYSRPVNIRFDGSLLNLYYDNGTRMMSKNLTEVDRHNELDGDKLASIVIRYTDDSNVSDTISYVVDYSVGYIQFIIPAKNSKGESVGYTSYKQFVKGNELASK